ncbi:ARM repeat-containing protein [Sodiomyces alkalinus F11]|uniref:ARM repeat-containing protein n=1 Tax=Sodiomyces alkalinus (strain CBS 110278 / VKM F-3762 / F11) TaxID=1314773 RepID=A0A3N2QA50_SODAK|nr:ARM repeat-containing protein [Sodiomyces alkalinus F11]ROT43622.1 ARM repeat-containing protein [Sodiomyces alkalinus F11]
MSFAVEVPGDANPLSVQELCRALEAATSNDFAKRQAAGRQLASWEDQNGFYSSLQSVFLDQSIPTDIRFLAVIQLKNGIDKHWRLANVAKGGLTPGEKDIIRQRLIQGTLAEREKSLALQSALATARIIRIDYPRQWPDALPSLIRLLRSTTDQPHQLYGTLQIILQVVKEMSTARLKSSQTALQSITPEMAYVLGEIYAEKTPVWVNYLSGGQVSQDEADMALLNSLSALKTLRRLLISGYEAPHKDKTVQQFWALSQTQFGHFLAFVSQDSSVPAPYREAVGKHLMQFTKLHISMARSQPAAFAALPSSVPLVHAYWDLVEKLAEVFDKSEGVRYSGGNAGGSKAKAEGPLLEKLATRALILIKSCLELAYLPKHTFAYRGAEARKEEGEAVEFIKTELFTFDFTVRMANTILSRLFVFRKCDLEAWEEDPEDWEHHERFEGSAWEWEVRPAAEKVFLTLLNHKKDILIPSLLTYVDNAKGGQGDFSSKDALYTAMGLAAMHLVQKVDFNAFLAENLVPDAQQTGPLAKVLRRRIAILIGQWPLQEVTLESRSIIYGMFRHFLNSEDPDNDVVVLITSARNLQMVLDDLDFNAEAFAPHAQSILQELAKLISDLGNDETRLAVLETIRIAVTRLESHAARFGDFVMSATVQVFETTGAQEFMIKTAIVGIFTALVNAMGSDSQRYHSMMVPLIRETAQPSSELHLTLIEEVLELWNSVLMQSRPPVSAEIIEIAPLVLPVLEYSPEIAGPAIETVEGYILMAPQSVLGDHLRRPFLAALSGAMEAKSREQAKTATRCIEYIIRAAEQLGGTDGVSVVVQDMLETGFFNKILERLHDAWEARQTTGPNRKVPQINVVTEGDYFAILARLALADPTLFVNVLASFGSLDQQVWPWLAGEWFAYMESWDLAEHRKLTLLGLTRLAELPHPVQDLVLGKLQDYLALWADTVAELQGGVVDGEDCLIWEALGPSEYDTPRSLRERELAENDPVHRIVAKRFVRERLQDLVQRAGGEQKFQEDWLVNVDKDVVQRFSRYVGVS